MRIILLYLRIKRFNLEPDMSNLQIFLDLNGECAQMSNFIKQLELFDTKNYIIKSLVVIF